MFRTQEKLQRILSRRGVKAFESPCIHYFKAHQNHFYGALMALTVFLLILPQTFIKTREKLHEILPVGGELKEYKEFHEMIESGTETSTPFGNCKIYQPRHPEEPLNPIMVATFPGSSSDLMRLLIETMTGTWTGARTFRDDVIAIKTHFPVYDNHINMKQLLTELKGDPARVILILKDPMYSIKAFYDYIRLTSEQRGDPPPEEWTAWCEMNFDSHIEKWEIFTKFWLSHPVIEEGNKHVVVYESLVDPKSGVQEATDIMDFMKRVTRISEDRSSEIICLWSRVVQFNVKADEPAPRRRLQTYNIGNEMTKAEASPRRILRRKASNVEIDSQNNLYTFVQLNKIAGILTQLIDELSLEDHVLQALLKYRMSALESMKNLMNVGPVLVSNSHGTCMVTTPQYEPMIPMFQASYPGSGSEMMRDLLSAITGVQTAETKRRNDVVAVKTFFPYRSFDIHPSFLNSDMKKLVLLVRYPLHAISSNFNHIYWKQNHLQAHSVQPPKEAWEDYRDAHFDEELDAWIEHTEYWISHFKGLNRLVISYESLTNEETGPQDAMRLSLFIRSIYNEGTLNPAPVFTLPCLWFRAVRILDESNSDMFQDSSNHSGEGVYRPAFTTIQLEKTATKLNSLLTKMKNEKRIAPILQSYWEHTVNQIH